MESINNSRADAEEDLGVEAYRQAVRSSSGLGGRTRVDLNTPKPWAYEVSRLRRWAWLLIRMLDKVRWPHSRPTYTLPLDLGCHEKGRLVVWHSRVEVPRLSAGEKVLSAVAYFDHYPHLP